MPGYVDPFANRATKRKAADDGSDPSSDDAAVVVDDDEDLDARDDEVDPVHRVRSV
jgi:hypothetical protein